MNNEGFWGNLAAWLVISYVVSLPAWMFREHLWWFIWLPAVAIFALPILLFILKITHDLLAAGLDPFAERLNAWLDRLDQYWLKR